MSDRTAPTIREVARRAGVSRQTVSNVLNAPERVRPATRERVQRVVDELGYRPHRSAQNLKAQRTRTLGYLVQPAPPGTINAVLDRFLHALTDAARTRGYHVLLFTREAGGRDVDAYAELIASRAVDGFIVSETNYGDERVRYLIDQGVPMSVFGRTQADMDHPYVDVDNALGTRQAVEHLTARGHERIGFLGWPAGSVTGDERRRGYEEGLERAGLQADPALTVRGRDGSAPGRAATAALLDRAQPPTAIVACSDLLAVGALQAAADRAVAVGRQLAVVGFDDTPVAPFLTPALTSVRQPLEEAAAAVVAQVVHRIRAPAAPLDSRLLPPQLIVRAST